MKRNICFALAAFCLISCNKEPINTAPTASFFVQPDFGDTETPFIFDASSSTDVDQDDSSLWVRWDWESDGIYDGFFVQTKKHTRKFPAPGTYNVRLEVRDDAGAKGTTEQIIEVFRGSAAPLEPFAPNPPDSANHILFNGRLSWVAVDPDDDPMEFDVFLGTDPDPPLVASGLEIDQYYPTELIAGEKYYWKVLIRDELMKETEGPVWRFSTHSGTYLRDSLIDDRDGAVYETIFLNGQWWMAENLRYHWENRSFCVENQQANCETYGRYYDIHLQDTLVCPKGWRYPNWGEWRSLELYLGMESEEARKYGVWRGSDQATQILEGGTSGLNFKLTGYRDDQGKWQYVGERLYFGSINRNPPSRMAIEGYGGILQNNFDEAQYVPVRCIK